VLRHCVMFRWAEPPSAEELAAIGAALDGLVDAVPGIEAYHHGSDAGVGEGTWDYAVVGDFADAETYRAYAAHPAHVAVVTGLIRPRLAERAAVQFEW
jgi:hypothetical protein